MTSPVIARLDLYPANMTVGGVMHMNVRVIATADEIYAYRDGFNGEGPVEILHDRMEDFSGKNTTGWTALASTVGEVFFQRSTGCGCGSRLRSYRPFPQGLSVGYFPE